MQSVFAGRHASIIARKLGTGGPGVWHTRATKFLSAPVIGGSRRTHVLAGRQAWKGTSLEASRNGVSEGRYLRSPVQNGPSRVMMGMRLMGAARYSHDASKEVEKDGKPKHEGVARDNSAYRPEKGVFLVLIGSSWDQEADFDRQAVDNAIEVAEAFDPVTD